MRCQILASTCLLTAAATFAQSPITPASAPATRPANAIAFDFRDAPVDSILDALAENFNLTIIRPATPIPGRITIMSRGKDAAPLTAAQAIEITHSLLLPLGYGLIETSGSPGDAPTYRLAPVGEIKKQAPLGISQ